MDAHCDTNEGLQAGGPPTGQLGQQRCSVLASLLHRPRRVGRIPLASCRTWGLFKRPSWPGCTRGATHVCWPCTHACMQSFTASHSLTYTTQLINPQITQPIITTLVLIRNYLKHFPIRVYMLSWAGVCFNKPTGFIVGGGGSFTHTCTCTSTRTFLDLTVVIRPSQRVPLLGRGG